MSEFRGPIRRVDTAKSHHYQDADGRRVPGVTTLIGGGIPKPALINWAGKATAEYAADHWDELEAMSPSGRINTLSKCRYFITDAAKDRGTEVHALAERLARGEEVDVPDAIAGHVESCVAFLDEWEPQVIALEATVFSVEYGYAGTLDGIFYFPTLDQTLVIDYKTNRTGIFGETAVQLAAYRYAEHYVGADGAQHPMPATDGAAAIHIRADGYSLIPVTAGPSQLETLRHAAAVRAFCDESRDLIGNPLDPPTAVHRRHLSTTRTPYEEAS